MTRKLISRLSCALVAVLALVNLATPLAAAAPLSGITIAPAKLTLTIDKDYPVLSSSVGVKNESEAKSRIGLELSDVAQIGDKLLLSNSGDDSILDWVDLPVKEVALEAGTSINIPVTVRDSDKIGPGSHYFAIIINQLYDPSEKVQLTPAVQVIVEVVKETGAVRQLSASFTGLKKFTFSLPKTVDMVIKNTGNTTVVPRAAVQVLRSDQVALKGVINENSVPLLASLDTKQRAFMVRTSRLPGLGRVKITADVRIDGQDQVQHIETTFFYIPKTPFIVFALIFAAGYYFRKWRRKKRTKKAPLGASIQDIKPRPYELSKPPITVSSTPVVAPKINKINVKTGVKPRKKAQKPTPKKAKKKPAPKKKKSSTK